MNIQTMTAILTLWEGETAYKGKRFWATVEENTHLWVGT